MILRKTIRHNEQMFKCTVPTDWKIKRILLFFFYFIFYFAHAHYCLKFIMRLKFAGATDLEFIAEGKRNNKKK
jgi:hypothetical protein